jgi:hypothetical protein
VGGDVVGSTPLPPSDNPYEAPAAFDAVAQPGVPIEVPAGFFGKFSLALRLFFGDLPTIGAIVLTVWLPGNILIESVLQGSPKGDDFSSSWRINSLGEMVLGPPVAGAILAVLAARMDGRRIGFRAALRVGIGSWGPLFGARFVAGFLTLLGLILLIVPGVVLAVRYALIDPVVVLEGEGVHACRVRSAQLVKGRGWQIVLVWLITTLLFVGWIITAGVLAESLSPLASFWGCVATDCVGDLANVLIIVWMFLYYWEAIRSGSKKSFEDDAGMSLA